jgi:chemotaxis protein CheD
VLEFLKVEGIRILAQDLLDVCPRKVHFFVDSGKVQVKRLSLTPSEPMQRREREYLQRIGRERGGDVEIFSSPR